MRNLWLIPLVLMGSATAADKSFPPYPAVWDLELPSVPAGTNVDLHLSLLADGEVLVSFAEYTSTPGGRGPRHLMTFFTRRPIDARRSDLGGSKVVYASGVETAIVREQSSRAELPDGRRVVSLSHVYRKCYRGPVRQTIALGNSAGGFDNWHVVFYLLDKPETFVGGGDGEWLGPGTGPACPNEEPLELRVPVVALAGLFLPLPDGTILFAVPSRSLVVRLTKELETRSKLLNRKMFIFPYDSRDGELFVKKLTGKDYGFIEDGTARYQEALDDLHNYLLGLKTRN